MNWISPRLLSLLDYLMHKAPYWSVQNYEKRLDEDVRVMQHVIGVHKDFRENLTGLSGKCSLPTQKSTLTYMRM